MECTCNNCNQYSYLIMQWMQCLIAIIYKFLDKILISIAELLKKPYSRSHRPHPWHDKHLHNYVDVVHNSWLTSWFFSSYLQVTHLFIWCAYFSCGTRHLSHDFHVESELNSTNNLRVVVPQTHHLQKKIKFASAL